MIGARAIADYRQILDRPAELDYKTIVYQYFSLVEKGLTMHAIDLFQFSKHLRDSGKFSSEQTEALADALFAAMNDIDVDQPHVPIRQQPEHNKTTAALLGIFLGGIGAHKFYLGRSLQGVFYLIFCWTLIPAIIGFVEGLYYLSYTMDEFTAEYG